MKCRTRSLVVYSNEFILGTVGSACMGSENIVGKQNHCRSITYFILTYRTKILDVDELKRRIISEWATLNHAAIDSAVREWRQRLRTCVRAGGGHFEHTLK